MLDESGTPDTFLGEVPHTTVKIMKKAHVRVNSDRTSYELWYGNIPTVKHFRVFRRKCFINKNDEKLGKFESRADEGIFLGYSSRIKAYKCYNKILQKIVKCIDVVIDESLSTPKREIPTTNEDDVDVYLPTPNSNNIEGEPNEALEEDLFENVSIQVRSKESSRISNFGRKGTRCPNKKNSCRIS